jgi:hypothetical protein
MVRNRPALLHRVLGHGPNLAWMPMFDIIGVDLVIEQIEPGPTIVVPKPYVSMFLFYKEQIGQLWPCCTHERNCMAIRRTCATTALGLLYVLTTSWL